jgi:hypothetical protein
VVLAEVSLAQVSLAQQFAQRHDTPRAMIAACRTKTRHNRLAMPTHGYYLIT